MKIRSTIKILLLTVAILGFSSFYKQNNSKKIFVLVLPPYDEISNLGVAPPVKTLIEENSADNQLTIMKFPFKKLLGIPYHNVFDKKYCKPILQKVKSDIIIMSKLEQVGNSENLEDYKWNLRIRIYNVGKNTQADSSIKGDSLNTSEIKSLIFKNKAKLINEIKTTNKYR